VQPETLPKNSNFSSCLQNIKLKNNTTYNSKQVSYPLPNIASFLFRLEFRFRSRDFSFNLFPVWQPYCWRFWSVIVVHIQTSTINAPELRERIKFIFWTICSRCRKTRLGVFLFCFIFLQILRGWSNIYSDRSKLWLIQHWRTERTLC
jgi:hypothetical protein